MELNGLQRDSNRQGKGRLVKERRNIISPRSRRGFVLHRLPSASVALRPPPLLSYLKNLL